MTILFGLVHKNLNPQLLITVATTKNATLMFSKKLKLIFIPADNFYFFNSQVNVFVYILKHINNTKKTPPPSMTPGSLPSSLSTSSFLPPRLSPTAAASASSHWASWACLEVSRGVPRTQSLYLLPQDWDAGNLLLLELVLEPIPEVFNRLRSGEFRGHPDLGDSREQDQEQDTDSEEHWRLGGHRTDGDLQSKHQDERRWACVADLRYADKLNCVKMAISKNDWEK